MITNNVDFIYDRPLTQWNICVTPDKSADPAPFLIVSFEMKKEDSLKPYDAKKSVWVPNKEDGGYDEGLIQVRIN